MAPSHGDKPIPTGQQIPAHCIFSLDILYRIGHDGRANRGGITRNIQPQWSVPWNTMTKPPARISRSQGMF